MTELVVIRGGAAQHMTSGVYVWDWDDWEAATVVAKSLMLYTLMMRMDEEDGNTLDTLGLLAEELVAHFCKEE